MSATTRTTRQGFKFSMRMAQMIDAVNVLMRTAEGDTSGDMRILQGSWSDADASGGTHTGDGAGDFSDFNGAKREKWFRKLGGAGYRRAKLVRNGVVVWNPHIHVIQDGNPYASDAARRQVVEYHNRGDALVGDAPDTGYHMYVFPEFLYGTTRARWICIDPTHAYSQPTKRTETQLDTVMVTGQDTTYNDVCRVVVGSTTEWFVTRAGHFFKRSEFVRRPTGYVRKTQRWVVAAAKAYGRDRPGPDGLVIGTALPRGKTFTSYGYCSRVVDGRTVWYVMNAGGRWFTGTSLDTAVA